jgi:ketosteroid isomerase-like protein
MIAALLLAAAAAHWAGAAQAEQQIRAERGAFNRAIARGDIPAIAAVLADNAQLISGDLSTLTAGKQAQVALWSQDLKDKSRGIYVRTPNRIQLSPVLPMAMESGHWRGVDSKSRNDWALGVYAAKWRRFRRTWKVETETYMTTACGGSWCPKPK